MANRRRRLRSAADVVAVFQICGRFSQSACSPARSAGPIRSGSCARQSACCCSTASTTRYVSSQARSSERATRRFSGCTASYQPRALGFVAARSTRSAHWRAS